ncbi:Mitochondrial transcription factor 1 [Actinomortierella ambigua]|uniref:rRNA adenine N(6)-methyltransferase n=1 Tax=Actinomortierella ambigua TaxID=1343610 RepID=A0A9P6Q9Q3_9FUNG|nr:Mitochondrial transcription factor 1 [Actinomortierella ambigua]
MSIRPLLKSLPRVAAPELWQTLFKGSKAKGQLRVSVMSEDAAGPGQWTRSMAMRGANKVITVEPHPSFQASLKTLQDASEGRIVQIQHNPFFEPVEDLLLHPKNGVLNDIRPQSWDNVHTDLVLAGSIPHSMQGEKFLQDLIMSSIEREGIFRLGRVEMFFFCYKDTIKKLSAAPGEMQRHRLGLITEAAMDLKTLYKPGISHFYLPYDYQLLHIVPHSKPKLESSLETLDFCLRSLFAQKSKPLDKVIKLLAPGADILLNRLSFDTNIRIKDMTLDQFNEVALKFDQWPLRPDTLHEDMILQERKRK